jgi:hypothetical protein
MDEPEKFKAYYDALCESCLNNARYINTLSSQLAMFEGNSEYEVHERKIVQFLPVIREWRLSKTFRAHDDAEFYVRHMQSVRGKTCKIVMVSKLDLWTPATIVWPSR